MSKKIKLIWDFRGPNGLKTAQHHGKHLKEFAQIEKLNFYEIDQLELSDLHCLSFIVIDEKDMKIYRDALKPHRGQLA
jgi:hypothetical protein|tara:strand:- start:108 stop:341 length:234 start_codon:yes stop_codon:yes gene_type:complete